MSSVLERSLALLELLSTRPEGMAVSAIAAALDMPPSGAHRLLNQLVQYGYVQQDGLKGDYALTMKLAALGLSFLGQSGVNEIAQPILDGLARESRELVRLSVVDGGNLVWVAVAQGATGGGLRYDPGREQGVVAHLASSSSGLAWLSTMSDDEALMKVAVQGFALPTSGPRAPGGPADLLARLAETRTRGFAITVDTFIPGMSAMAAPVRSGGSALGAVSIAGPSVRFTEPRMLALGPALLAAAADMGQAARASIYFRRSAAGAAAPALTS